MDDIVHEVFTGLKDDIKNKIKHDIISSIFTKNKDDITNMVSDIIKEIRGDISDKLEETIKDNIIDIFKNKKDKICMEKKKELDTENPNLKISLTKNREDFTNVSKYLQTSDISYLSNDIEIVKEIFNYFDCDEYYILDIITSDDYKKCIDYYEKLKDKNTDFHLKLQKDEKKYDIKYYNQKLFKYYEKTLLMMNYIDENLIHYFENNNYVKLFSDLNTTENIYNYYCEYIDDLKSNKLKDVKFLSLQNIYGELECGILPNGLTSLEFDSDLEEPLKIGVLPDSLKKLSINGDIYQSIDKGLLPNNLEELYLYCIINKPIEKDVLPKSLKHLEFGDDCIQPIEKDVLPNGITYLNFSEEFNLPIEKDVLPNSLTYLGFGGEFNQPIEKDVLPNSLKEIHFGRDFNQPIEKGVLPDSLKEIHFGRDFNQIIIDILPNNLKDITVNIKYKYISSLKQFCKKKNIILCLDEFKLVL